METMNLSITDIATINRIADLMEEGSQGVIQGTGYFFNLSSTGLKVCAMGACMLAKGLKPDNHNNLEECLEVDHWPMVAYPSGVDKWLMWRNNPIDTEYELHEVVMALNDKAGWSFTQIIAWLRQIVSQAIPTSQGA